MRRGGSGSPCEAHVTYAERGFGLASKKRDTRGDGGPFLDEYYRFTLSFAAWVHHSGAVGEGGLDGRVASNVQEREGNTPN